MRGRRCRRPRVVARVGPWSVLLRTGRWSLVAAGTALVAAAVAARAAGAPTVLVVGVPLVAAWWLAASLRLARPSRPGPGRPPRPPDAGVREPRRPHPRPPAGAVALPVPEEPPEDAVALA